MTVKCQMTQTGTENSVRDNILWEEIAWVAVTRVKNRIDTGKEHTMSPRSIVISLLALSLFIFSAVQAGEKSKTGSISGCITDPVTGLPVINAKVTIIETYQEATTDSSGCFDFVGVAPGQYHLSITHANFGTIKGLVELTVKVSAEKTSKLSLSLASQSVKQGGIVQDSRGDMNKTIDVLGVDRLPSTSPKLSAPQLESFDRVPQGSSYAPKCAPAPYYEPPMDYNQPPQDMFFRDYGTNGFVDTRRDRFSTFAIDVDDVSYNIVHRYLQDGLMPPSDAVRVEEFINHFNYGYNGPVDETFRVFTEITNSPFERDRYIMKLAVKGREIAKSERSPLNITFVIDVSGSMNEGDRFDLVRESIKTLARQLNSRDQVGIVAYGSQAYVALDPVSGNRSGEVWSVVDRLEPGGSTYAEAGIRLGYEMANNQYVNGHNNVIVLCSDGVANVGRTSPEAIMNEVQRFARKGITLSTFGYGMGNYNDVLLEQLATKGNGRYAYINNDEDIRTAMVDNFVSNLQVLGTGRQDSGRIRPEECGRLSFAWLREPRRRRQQISR